ncbi:uncharacterized protein [Prorops nasuta]|uniref:uncharacterized protein isoform X2 n=1 Tax=Prorops nasuta TaxID=863751 RepID=UPI0034CDD2F1
MSETRNHLRSVSDLYAADEIEVLLLEEIRELELPPSAYSRPEDIQEFEIGTKSSRTGGRISSQSSELDSPGIHSTVHSWDSHANYRGHYGHSDHHRHGSSSNALPWPRANHLVFYCDIQGHLKTATGVFRVLLLISSAACLATLCSSGTAKVSLFMLPLVGRLRFMIFIAVFCILITALLLFLDISHIIYIFPFNWSKLNAWVFTGIGLAYTLGSALLASSIWEYHSGGWVPRRTRSQLSASAGIGLFCTLFSFILSWIHGRNGSTCKGQNMRDRSQSQQLYKPVDNSSSSGVTLRERSPRRSSSWARSQQSKKRSDSDANTTNGHRGNNSGSYDKYKHGNNRKDHWASARQHFLPNGNAEEEDEEEDGAAATTQITDTEIEKRRRRRKRGTGGDTDGIPIDNVDSSANKVDNNRTEEATTRRVPRKLPLQTVENAQPRQNTDHRNIGSKQIKPKSSKIPANTDVRNYWSMTESRSVEISGNGLHWEPEGTASSNSRDEAADIDIIRTAVWSGQWHPPPDDVQPCSSKTVDPYTFA